MLPFSFNLWLDFFGITLKMSFRRIKNEWEKIHTFIQNLFIWEQRISIYIALTLVRSILPTQWQQSFPSLGSHARNLPSTAELNTVLQ